MLVVAATTLAVYGFLLVLLRLAGRRQLGQLTVLDLIVVLVLGSTVETSMIHGDVSLPAGLVSAATLFVVNRLLTVAMLRSRRLSQLVNGGPVLLVADGRMVDEHLHRAGLAHDDVLQALREKGCADPRDARYAVLETDGDITVVFAHRERPRRPDRHDAGR